jgi:hypothetical protein
VSLDVTTLSLSQFSKRVRGLQLDTTQTPFQQFNVHKRQEWIASICDKSLLFLLDWFRDKHCSLAHDRVFALLAICQKSDRLAVDYDMHWTDLALHVLKKSQYGLCVCSATLVSRSLISGASKVYREHQACSREPMLSFDSRQLVVYEWMDVERAYRMLSSVEKYPHEPFACLLRLTSAFLSLFRRCELSQYIRDNPTKKEEKGKEPPFPEAIHQTLTLERARLWWQRDPDNEAYLLYKDNEHWDIRICETDREFYKVRIALSKLQEIIPETNLCVFSGTDYAERDNLFEIEWA